MLVYEGGLINTQITPIVRTAPLKKMKRLRVAWFILGMVVGGTVAYSAASVIHAQELSKRHMKSPVYAQTGVKSTIVATAVTTPTSLSSSVSTPSVVATPAPAVAPVAKVVPPKPTLPANIHVPVQEGDTLMSMLMERGIAKDEAQTIVSSMKKVYNPRSLNVGQSLEFHLDKSQDGSDRPMLSSLSIAVSPAKTIALNRTSDDSYTTREIKAPVTKGLGHASGTIKSSFYETGINAGLTPQMLGEIINAFSYDVDFARDIQEGDALNVVYERMHTDKDVTTGYGNVVYAELTLGDDKLAIYRHVSSDGFSGYYNAKGESVKKALLKTPVNGARITSGFGMRMHPLLGYSKMHKGIDFGAAVGTPIYAAGDGTIEEAGYKGTFGNYVRIKHNDKYETAYGHASRIARGIHPGVHVKQGQVIAYVGSTGRSTGPHLHYEILVAGSQVNPAGVKFRTGQQLAGKDMASFKRQVKEVDVALATPPKKTQVASIK